MPKQRFRLNYVRLIARRAWLGLSDDQHPKADQILPENEVTALACLFSGYGAAPGTKAPGDADEREVRAWAAGREIRRAERRKVYEDRGLEIRLDPDEAEFALGALQFCLRPGAGADYGQVEDEAAALLDRLREFVGDVEEALSRDLDHQIHLGQDEATAALCALDLALGTAQRAPRRQDQLEALRARVLGFLGMGKAEGVPVPLALLERVQDLLGGIPEGVSTKPEAAALRNAIASAIMGGKS